MLLPGEPMMLFKMMWQYLRCFALVVSLGLNLNSFAALLPIPASERATLLEIYASTGGPSWTNRSGWGGSVGSECGWYGISCVSLFSNGDLFQFVRQINLQSNNLRGPLPSLSGFQRLVSFAAPSNELTGNIPSLAGLPELLIFVVNMNHLTGPVPDLGAAPKLLEFHAYNNDLSGPMTSLVSSTLQVFMVQFNKLSGVVPTLVNAPSLRYFRIADNRFIGALPAPPPLLLAGESSLCNNFLRSTGSETQDHAWDLATGFTPVNGAPGWVGCQQSIGTTCDDLVTRQNLETLTSGSSITIKFRPQFGDTAVGVQNAASICGHDHFNWKSVITSGTIRELLPDGGRGQALPFNLQNCLDHTLDLLESPCDRIKSSSGEFVSFPNQIDPPHGGYAYHRFSREQQPTFPFPPAADSVDWYYDEDPAVNQPLSWRNWMFSPDDSFRFFDRPEAPEATHFEFLTTLVGVGPVKVYDNVIQRWAYNGNGNGAAYMLGNVSLEGPDVGTTTFLGFVNPGDLSKAQYQALLGLPTLDIDLSAPNANYDALTDGLLILRYLFGVTGSTLTLLATTGSASRTSPTAVKGYLDGMRRFLDIDDDGTADALTDGLLIVRYLFGLRGNSLVAGAVSPTGARKTAEEIETYLQSLTP